MSQRLKALVLAISMLAPSVAPAAAACVAGSDQQAGMDCCARDTHCGRAALQPVCCPCARQTPSTSPSPAALAPAPFAPVLAGDVPVAPPASPGPLSLHAQAAFAAALLRISHDPPWLLNASLLI
jgi:hypothetical protein